MHGATGTDRHITLYLGCGRVPAAVRSQDTILLVRVEGAKRVTMAGLRRAGLGLHLPEVLGAYLSKRDASKSRMNQFPGKLSPLDACQLVMAMCCLYAHARRASAPVTCPQACSTVHWCRGGRGAGFDGVRGHRAPFRRSGCSPMPERDPYIPATLPRVLTPRGLPGTALSIYLPTGETSWVVTMALFLALGHVPDPGPGPCLGGQLIR